MRITSAARNTRPTRENRLDRNIPSVPVLQFTIKEFEDLIEEGILKNPERVEFLNGWIVPKMTHNPRHDSAVFRLQMRLIKLLGEQWLVRVQSAIRASGSLPEPDLVVAAGPEGRYDRVRPTPKEIGLLVEISDSTLGQDRGIKKELYAKDRIKIYWIINLVEKQVEVYTLPHSGKKPAYRHRQIFLPGESVPVMLNGETAGSLAVSELLP